MRIRAAFLLLVVFYLDRGDAFHAYRLVQGSRGFRDGGCRYGHRQAYSRTSAARGVWMSMDGPAAAVGAATEMPRTTTFSISTAAARPSWTRAVSLWDRESVGMSHVSVPREGSGDDGRQVQVPFIAASNLDIDIPVLEPFRSFQGSLLAFVGIPLLVLAGFAISRSSSVRSAPAPSAEEMERLSTEDILKKLYDDVEGKVKEKYASVDIAPVVGEEEVAAAVAETAAKAGVSEGDVRSAAIAATTVDVNAAAGEGQHADVQTSSSTVEAERPTHEVVEESTPAPEQVEQKAVDLMKDVEKEEVAAMPDLKRESAREGVEATVRPVAEPEEHRDTSREQQPLEADVVRKTVAAIEERKEDSEGSDQQGRVQEAEVKFRERLEEERERVTRKRRQEEEARTARRDMRTAPTAEDREAVAAAEEVQDAEWREMRRLQEESEQFFGASAHSRRSPAAAAPEAEFIKSRASSVAPIEAPEVVSEGDSELEQTREELLRGLDAVVADLERKAQRKKEAEAEARQQSQARPPDTEVRRQRADAETDKEKVVAYVKGLTVARLKAILQDNGQRLPGSKARKADYVEAVVELARLKTSGRFDNTDFMSDIQ